jgi:hypothetical protein
MKSLLRVGLFLSFFHLNFLFFSSQSKANNLDFPGLTTADLSHKLSFFIESDGVADQNPSRFSRVWRICQKKNDLIHEKNSELKKGSSLRDRYLILQAYQKLYDLDYRSHWALMPQAELESAAWLEIQEALDDWLSYSGDKKEWFVKLFQSYLSLGGMVFQGDLLNRFTDLFATQFVPTKQGADGSKMDRLTKLMCFLKEHASYGENESSVEQGSAVELLQRFLYLGNAVKDERGRFQEREQLLLKRSLIRHLQFLEGHYQRLKDAYEDPKQAIWVSIFAPNEPLQSFSFFIWAEGSGEIREWKRGAEPEDKYLRNQYFANFRASPEGGSWQSKGIGFVFKPGFQLEVKKVSTKSFKRIHLANNASIQLQRYQELVGESAFTQQEGDDWSVIGKDFKFCSGFWARSLRLIALNASDPMRVRLPQKATVYLDDLSLLNVRFQHQGRLKTRRNLELRLNKSIFENQGTLENHQKIELIDDEKSFFVNENQKSFLKAPSVRMYGSGTLSEQFYSLINKGSILGQDITLHAFRLNNDLGKIRAVKENTVFLTGSFSSVDGEIGDVSGQTQVHVLSPAVLGELGRIQGETIAFQVHHQGEQKTGKGVLEASHHVFLRSDGALILPQVEFQTPELRLNLPDFSIDPQNIALTKIAYHGWGSTVSDIPKDFRLTYPYVTSGEVVFQEEKFSEKDSVDAIQVCVQSGSLKDGHEISLEASLSAQGGIKFLAPLGRVSLGSKKEMPEWTTSHLMAQVDAFEVHQGVFLADTAQISSRSGLQIGKKYCGLPIPLEKKAAWITQNHTHLEGGPLLCTGVLEAAGLTLSSEQTHVCAFADVSIRGDLVLAPGNTFEVRSLSSLHPSPLWVEGKLKGFDFSDQHDFRPTKQSLATLSNYGSQIHVGEKDPSVRYHASGSKLEESTLYPVLSSTSALVLSAEEAQGVLSASEVVILNNTSRFVLDQKIPSFQRQASLQELDSDKNKMMTQNGIASESQFSFAVHEKYFFDESHAQEFYQEIADSMVLLTSEGFKLLAPGQKVMMGLSPELLRQSLEKLIEAFNMSQSRNDRSSGVEVLKEFHRFSVEYLNEKKGNFEFTRDLVDSKRLSDPGISSLMEIFTDFTLPKNPMIFYVFAGISEGLPILKPCLYLPSQALTHKIGNIYTSDLKILPHHLDSDALVETLEDQEKVELSDYFTKNPKISQNFNQVVSYGAEKKNKKQPVQIQTEGSLGSFLVITDGCIDVQASLKSDQTTLISWDGRIQVRSGCNAFSMLKSKDLKMQGRNIRISQAQIQADAMHFRSPSGLHLQVRSSQFQAGEASFQAQNGDLQIIHEKKEIEAESSSLQVKNQILFSGENVGTEGLQVDAGTFVVDAKKSFKDISWGEERRSSFAASEGFSFRAEEAAFYGTQLKGPGTIYAKNQVIFDSNEPLVLPEVHFQTPQLALRVPDFGLDPQIEVKSTVFEWEPPISGDRNQTIRLSHPYTTSGELVLKEKGYASPRDLQSASFVEAIRLCVQKDLFASDTDRSSYDISLEASLSAKKGMVFLAPLGRVRVGKNTQLITELLSQNLFAHVNAFELLQGVVVSEQAKVFSQKGVQIGTHVGDRKNVIRSFLDFPLNQSSLDSGKSCSSVIALQERSAWLTKNETMLVGGPLLCDGILEAGRLSLDSSQAHICASAQIKIRGNLVLAHGNELVLTHLREAFPEPSDLFVEKKLEDVPAVVSDDSVNLEHLEEEKKDSISIQSYSSLMRIFSDELIMNYDAQELPDGKYILPSIFSTISDLVIPQDNMQGLISAPSIVILQKDNTLALGKENPYFFPPQIPFQELEEKKNLLTDEGNFSSLLDDRWGFSYREKYFFDEKHAKRFHKKIAKSIVILTEQGVKLLAPEQKAVFLFSPYLLQRSIQQVVQKTMRRHYIHPRRSVNQTELQFYHDYAWKYWNAQEDHEKLSYITDEDIDSYTSMDSVQVGSLMETWTHLNEPQNPLVFYTIAGTLNDVPVLKPYIYLPLALIEEARSSRAGNLYAIDLQVLPGDLTPDELIESRSEEGHKELLSSYLYPLIKLYK